MKKCVDAKHNPLQRLTYLAVSAILLPLQMVTGLLYHTYNDWPGWGVDAYVGLGPLAVIHTLTAFLLLSFLIVHVYMTTTGRTLGSHVTAMWCGWEEVGEGAEIEDWERAEKKI